MTPVNVELAGGRTVADIMASRRASLTRAPAWWRAQAQRAAAVADNSPPPRARRPAKAQQPIGWVYGVACVGVSDPAWSQSDNRRIPEQFTDDCIRALVRQANSGNVSLTWGHSHDTLVTTGPSLDLLFFADEFYGMTFVARLHDSPLNRRVLEEVDGGGVLGCSVGYDRASGWTVDRRGYGTVRIVNACRLHHVAILGRDSGLKPCYPAARMGGRRSSGPGLHPDVRFTVNAVVCRELIRQANVMA